MTVPFSDATAAPLHGGVVGFARKDYLAAAATAFAALILYIWCLPRTVTGEDAGELAAAAYVLGIPHPPGYPLWCLLAHTFTWIPLHSVAWRVALFSAVMGAATILVVVLLAIHLCRRRFAGVLAGLALAVSPDFFGQSIVPEVYTLDTFFVAACWLLLVLWHERRDDRLLWYFAVLYGFSLANHYTMHLLGPVFGAFLLLSGGRPLQRFPLYAGMAALAFTIAFALYCYLPIRSLANPPVDWGNPETIANWWRHVVRGQYTFMITEEPRSGLGLAGKLAHFFGAWAVRCGIVMPLYALLGFVAFSRARRAPRAMVAASGALTFALCIAIQNPTNTIEWQCVMRVFSLPLSLAAATGAAMLLGNMSRAVSLGLAMPLLIVVFGNLAVRASESTPQAVEGYARRVLEQLPANAILVPNADHQSFPIHYLQVVEGIRPDVTLARKYGYLEAALWPEEMTRKYGNFPPKRYEAAMLAWLLQDGSRPVVFFSRPNLPIEGIRFESCWLLQDALREGEPSGFADSPHCDLVEQDSLLSDSLVEARQGDYTAQVIALEWYFRLADQNMDMDLSKAMQQVQQGLIVYGSDATSEYNAGALCASHQQYDHARTYFESALRADPRHKPARDALARLAAMGH